MKNKFELLAHLKDKDILIKKDKTYFVKFNLFSLFRINDIIIEKKDNSNILILKNDQVIFQYWVEQDLFIPPWQTHWFQLKDSFLLKLKDNLLNEFLNKAIKNAGNLNKLCKYLDMSSPTFYNLTKNRIKMVSVKKLRRLLDYLNISYLNINNKIEYTKKGPQISIENPKFPIDLNSKCGASLLGAIVSDGCIYVDKKARGVIRTKYSTSEEESISHFIDSINRTYGKVYIQKEIVRNCIIIKIGSSIIGETLFKVGAILGHKAKVNGGAPWFIKLCPKDLIRYYLLSVFSDEASIYLAKKHYQSYIILSRYKHLKNITRKGQKYLLKLEREMISRRFPTGHINKSISIKKVLNDVNKESEFKTLLNCAPKLLLDESRLLNDFGIDNRIWGRSLNKTHKGNYSVCFDLFINKKDSILKFYKEIGFSLTNKQEKLIKLIDNRVIKDDLKTIQYTNKKNRSI